MRLRSLLACESQSPNPNISSEHGNYNATAAVGIIFTGTGHLDLGLEPPIKNHASTSKCPWLVAADAAELEHTIYTCGTSISGKRHSKLQNFVVCPLLRRAWSNLTTMPRARSAPRCKMVPYSFLLVVTLINQLPHTIFLAPSLSPAHGALEATWYINSKGKIVQGMFTRSTIVKLVPGTISMYSLGEGGHCKDMGWGYVVQTLYRYWCERGLIQYDFVRILDIRAGGGVKLTSF